MSGMCTCRHSQSAHLTVDGRCFIEDCGCQEFLDKKCRCFNHGEVLMTFRCQLHGEMGDESPAKRPAFSLRCEHRRIPGACQYCKANKIQRESL